jgi:general secretion pathway protein D
VLSRGYSLRRPRNGVTYPAGLMLLALTCMTGCAQLPLASQSGPSASPTDAQNLGSFRDLLNGQAAAKSDSRSSRSDSARAQVPNNNKDNDNNSNSKDDLQARIYEGESNGGQPIAMAGTNFATRGSGPAIQPAAYRVAEGGVTPADGDKFQVVFENADLSVVARAILGEALRVNYSIDPRVRGTISLSAQRPVSRSQLLWMLENALRAQGAVIVQQEGVYRVLPGSDAQSVGGANIGPDAGTPGFGITALPLQNISAEALNKILIGFGAATESIRMDPARNLLIVRGTTSERQWLIDTALAFDVDWMHNQSVGIFPVKNSSPEVIINEINQMADTSVVRMQPIARMNAILAVARSAESIHQVQTWITRFDRQTDFGPRAHVYRLKSADARKVVAVLKEVFGSGSATATSSADQTAPSGGVATAKAGPGQSPAPSADTNNVDAKVGQLAGAGDTGAPSKVRITADVTSNAIVVYATQEEYRRIEQAIIELDRPSAEVAIEAIAAEVTLNDNLNYGVQYFLQSAFRNGSGNSLPASISQLASGIPLTPVAPGANLVLGALANPSAVISALRDVTEVQVLSSPSLVVADNQPAVLQVGDQVPVTTGTATSVITTQSAIVNSVSYVDTGVILRVTPHISRTSEIRLDIEQEVSSVAQNANATTLTPTISQQKVKSTVVVDNGQTVLLGGLISQQRNQEKSGIPGVVDVPVIGNILSNSTNSANRTELIVFVQPHVIRNNVDAQRVAQELRKRMPGFNNW